jgi:hypothetical protein
LHADLELTSSRLTLNSEETVDLASDDDGGSALDRHVGVGRVGRTDVDWLHTARCPIGRYDVNDAPAPWLDLHQEAAFFDLDQHRLRETPLDETPSFEMGIVLLDLLWALGLDAVAELHLDTLSLRFTLLRLGGGNGHGEYEAHDNKGHER